MISLTMRRVALVFSVFALGLFVLACGDDDDVSETGSPTPSEAGTGSATPTPAVILIPPIEGPRRGPPATERTDFREDPEWDLPAPDDLPPVPDDENETIFFPPLSAECPGDWLLIQRPSEGFRICHPSDWQDAGTGYVTDGAEDRWYGQGIVKFADENRDRELAHVSVYWIPRFTRPMTYTRDCPQPFGITFAGQPAVICPEFPDEAPREDFTSYHIRLADVDYFVQVVSFEGGDDASYDLAVQIAHTFQLLEQPAP